MKARVTKQGNLWVAKPEGPGFNIGEEIALDLPIGDGEWDYEQEDD